MTAELDASLIISILSLIGFPSIVVIVMRWAAKKISVQAGETKALKDGLQALLRAQMIDDYNKWSERGWAPIYARENFQNVWENYHSLGANGVMDDIKDKFLELPASPPEKGTEHD